MFARHVRTAGLWLKSVDEELVRAAYAREEIVPRSRIPNRHEEIVPRPNSPHTVASEGACVARGAPGRQIPRTVGVERGYAVH